MKIFRIIIGVPLLFVGFFIMLFPSILFWGFNVGFDFMDRFAYQIFDFIDGN